MINIENYKSLIEFKNDGSMTCSSVCLKCYCDVYVIYSKSNVDDISDFKSFLIEQCGDITHSEDCNANCEYCNGDEIVEEMREVYEEIGNPNTRHEEGIGNYKPCICTYGN